MNSVDWPTPVHPLTEKEIGLLEKIRSHIEIQENGCHIWTRQTMDIRKTGGRQCVKPLLYEIYCGMLIPTQKIYSKCGNARCINVNHLVRMNTSDALLYSKVGWDKYGKDEVESMRKTNQINHLLNKGYTDGECYRWNGPIHIDGYGQVGICVKNKKSHRVHRVMWELTYGEIDDSLMVRHKCRNRDCFKIDHLELGTSQDNYRDRERDGTGNTGRNTKV